MVPVKDWTSKGSEQPNVTGSLSQLMLARVCTEHMLSASSLECLLHQLTLHTRLHTPVPVAVIGEQDGG